MDTMAPKEKAGLDADHWSATLRVECYSAESFPSARRPSRAAAPAALVRDQ